MSSGVRPPPREVPTLTEVVGLPEAVVTRPGALVPDLPPAPPPPVAAPAVLPLRQRPVATAAPRVSMPPMTPLASSDTPLDTWLALQEDQITQHVLADVQRQVDKLLEYRLRESLGPLLARLTDTLVRDVRDELAVTLRDIVRRAVAQELSRHRQR
jgi:hypothetical protein